MQTVNDQTEPTISATVVVARSLILMAMLFGSAGTLAWPAAWIAVLSFVTFCMILWAWLRRHNPGLLQERLGQEKDSDRPKYDLFFSRVYKGCFLVWLLSLGLNLRFQWTEIPWPINVLGAVFLEISLVLIFWVFATNSFLAREVRIQHERAQTVVTKGPYRLVRHPMYTGIGLMFISTSLLLDSWVGVGIAGLLIALLGIRSVLEEATLSESLRGYADYKRSVQYRMIPLIW